MAEAQTLSLPVDQTIGEPPKVLGRRERNKLEKRARIVTAARRLFEEQGFAETTTVQIAEAADIGTGTLFLYAKTKEDLLVVVFRDEMLEVAGESFEALADDSATIDRLMAVFERMVAYHARDIDLTRILLRELIIPASTGRQQEIDELLRVIFAGLEKLIRSGQRRGEVPSQIDATLAAETVFGIYYFGLLSWMGNRIGRDEFLARTRQQISQLWGAPSKS